MIEYGVLFAGIGVLVQYGANGLETLYYIVKNISQSRKTEETCSCDGHCGCGTNAA